MPSKRVCRIAGCGRPFSAKDLCRRHYQKLKRYGDPSVTFCIQGDPDKFFDQSYQIDEATGCWIWTRAVRRGYGRIWANGRHIQAHRFAYVRFVGELSSEVFVDHVCMNKTCVNPSHLRVATPSDSVIYRVLRTNAKSGFRGVTPSPTKDKWYARIQLARRRIDLGTFDSAERAARAYDLAAIHLHGEFAMLNFRDASHAD